MLTPGVSHSDTTPKFQMACGAKYSQRQGHVHQVVKELFQGKGCVHSTLCSCLRHGTSDERASECRRSFDCLVLRASPLSARPAWEVGDFSPIREPSLEGGRGSVLSGLGPSIINVPNSCHGQVPACSTWLMSVSS